MPNEAIVKNKFNKTKIINFIVVAVFLVLGLNLLTTKSEKMFDIVGYKTYTVLSGSMEPTFKPGDLIITKNKNRCNIEVEDIATFKDAKGTVITHRIIGKSNEGYVTKGDNNKVEDKDIINEENIVGKVVFNIPKLGFAINFLSNPIVVAIEMILLSLFIFYYFKE
ncbi:signal peptidase I [Terrisporobacter petrolearius]|uniref:signal peptidase I n=1 Tax=Terrisporobacter petrolearius TaxID=1460447 RepID=UPI003AFFC70B